MITIRNIKIPVSTDISLKQVVLEKLNTGLKQNNKINIKNIKFRIIKKSLDARNKKNIHYIYTVDLDLPYLDIYKNNIDIKEAKDRKYRFLEENLDLIKKIKQNNHSEVKDAKNKDGEQFLKPRIVVVGLGPAGLFSALLLAEAGLKPLVIERGREVQKRIKDIDTFWEKGILNTESNVLFGEGGAGTFSDGKLSSQIKDKSNRFQKIFSELILAGASQEIAYNNKPHLGTDKLRKIVIELRKKIISLGGEIRFESKLTNIEIKNNSLKTIIVNDTEKIQTSYLVLAIGHSARDTVEILFKKGLKMEVKPFSVGLRIEHPQELINKIQYGDNYKNLNLPPADYKLVQHMEQYKSIYSFCMCPGGQVIASSSEKNTVLTNGMSFAKRDGENANSALLVGVSKDDFLESNFNKDKILDENPLLGIEYQRRLEQKAFNPKKPYYAPAQRLDDFMYNRKSKSFGKVHPTYKPGVYFCDFNELLPKKIALALKEGILRLDKKFKGFLYPDAVLTGLETRSSSPVRILRTDKLESINIAKIYPCGEGVGYAGGIMSSAVDGLKVAESIINSHIKCNT